MQYVCWERATTRACLVSIAAGVASAAVILSAAHLAGMGVAVAFRWSLLVLQLVLGPVLEEVVFRGYLLTAVLWSSRCIERRRVRHAIAVVVTAALFTAMHFIEPGRSLHEALAIGATGVLYGSIRILTGSSGPCALAHAAYNGSIILYVWSA
jgi:membrane protease YdiL (CAAX protease family)